MLNIDTDILKQLATEAQTSNQAMIAALQKIKTITDHNDWNCKERKEITQRMLRNKELAQKLTSASDDFTHNMNSMVAKFDDFRSEAQRAFDSLEELLSKKFSIFTPSKSFNYIPNPYKPGCIPIKPTIFYPLVEIFKKTKPIFRYDNYLLNNFTDDIKICNFNSFDFK